MRERVTAGFILGLSLLVFVGVGCFYAPAYHNLKKKNQCTQTEAVSVITDKYTEVHQVGKSTATYYYINVYNGNEDEFEFDIPKTLYDSCEVTDNVRLLYYWYEGRLYSVYVIDDKGIIYPCRNYIEERDNIF